MTPTARMGTLEPDRAADLAALWGRLGMPGATWTGSQRITIASAARSARAGEDFPSTEPEQLGDAIRAVATEPAGIRRDLVDGFVGSGLTAAHYVEMVGIVSRVVAFDAFRIVAGEPLLPLPPPEPGPVTGAVDPAARAGTAWVPMIAGANITNALSLVPAENAELIEVNRIMYMDVTRMSEVTQMRAITRPQMELIASRTSYLNECFY